MNNKHCTVYYKCDYCKYCNNCEECNECIYCNECDVCYGCKCCVECYDCVECEDCDKCVNCNRCNECVNCYGIDDTSDAKNKISYNDILYTGDFIAEVLTEDTIKQMIIDTELSIIDN